MQYFKTGKKCLFYDLLRERMVLGLEYLDLYLIHWPYAFQRGDNPFPRNEDQTMQ
jgi:alcohol dehydrogenase (NADP+)